MIEAKRVARVLACAAFLLIWRSALAFPPTLAEDEAPEDIARSHGDVVWLDFWASWCVPCRHSFPWMSAMQQKYGPLGLTVVAVNLDSDRADADRFLASMPAGFKVQFDPEGKLAKRYEVEAMPSSYVLDRTGHVIERHLGFKGSKEAKYEASIRTALGLEAESP
jgi:thiol-disulfide isomerase/thioredoxin